MSKFSLVGVSLPALNHRRPNSHGNIHPFLDKYNCISYSSEQLITSVHYLMFLELYCEVFLN